MSSEKLGLTEVVNLDQIRLYLREELRKALKPLIKEIRSLKFPEEIKVSISDSNLEDLCLYIKTKKGDI